MASIFFWLLTIVDFTNTKEDRRETESTVTPAESPFGVTFDLVFRTQRSGEVLVFVSCCRGWMEQLPSAGCSPT